MHGGVGTIVATKETVRAQHAPRYVGLESVLRKTRFQQVTLKGNLMAHDPALLAHAALTALTEANVPLAESCLYKILANDSRLGKVILSPDEIHCRVQELGQKIARDYPNGVHLVGILTAARRFTSDLASHITPPPEVDFLTPGKTLDFILEQHKIQVILCDTVHDTGKTLTEAKFHFPLARKCVLLEKDFANRPRPDYFAAICPQNKFVVGYGLDYQQAFRHFSYIVEFDVTK